MFVVAILVKSVMQLGHFYYTYNIGNKEFDSSRKIAGRNNASMWSFKFSNEDQSARVQMKFNTVSGELEIREDHNLGGYLIFICGSFS